MYLRRIALQRFKCFEAIDVECSKFTLLTGANSSGKSSLIYSVLGAVQTKNFPFYFSPNGNYVNMGDFVELAFNHRKTSAISIKLEFCEEESDKIMIFDGGFGLSTATRLPKLNCLNFKSTCLDLSIQKNGKYLAEFKYRPEEDSSNLRRVPGFRPALERFFVDMEKIASERAKKASKGKKANLPTVTEFIQEFFAENTRDRFTFAGSSDVFRQLSARASFGPHIREVTAAIPQYERSFNYVSSFRLPQSERTISARKRR